MTHEEQRIWLINELQKEDNQLSNYPIPIDEQGQKDLLRALMNVWMPKDLIKSPADSAGLLPSRLVSWGRG